MRSQSALLMLLVAIALVSCASTSITPPIEPVLLPVDQPEQEPPPELDVDIMTKDILSAIEQIFDPITTTVQINDDTDPVKQIVAYHMAQRGYGIQQVDSDQGSNYLNTTLTTIDLAGIRERFEILIGGISVSRDYDLDEHGQTTSTSPLITNYKSGSLDTKDMHFNENVTVNYSSIAMLDKPTPLISLFTPELSKLTANNPTGLPDVTAINNSRIEVANLFYSDSSFSDLFEDREKVNDLVLIFPNDSIYLGKDNKNMLRQFVSQVDDQESLIGVIGCSNGPTKYPEGNVGLALGRSQRIVEELQGLGIALERILDEGCWNSNTGVEGLPSRGVVIQQWVKG